MSACSLDDEMPCTSPSADCDGDLDVGLNVCGGLLPAPVQRHDQESADSRYFTGVKLFLYDTDCGIHGKPKVVTTMLRDERRVQVPDDWGVLDTAFDKVSRPWSADGDDAAAATAPDADAGFVKVAEGSTSVRPRAASAAGSVGSFSRCASIVQFEGYKRRDADEVDEGDDDGPLYMLPAVEETPPEQAADAGSRQVSHAMLSALADPMASSGWSATGDSSSNNGFSRRASVVQFDGYKPRDEDDEEDEDGPVYMLPTEDTTAGAQQHDPATAGASAAASATAAAAAASASAAGTSSDGSFTRHASIVEFEGYRHRTTDLLDSEEDSGPVYSLPEPTPEPTQAAATEGGATAQAHEASFGEASIVEFEGYRHRSTDVVGDTEDGPVYSLPSPPQATAAERPSQGCSDAEVDAELERLMSDEEAASPPPPPPPPPSSAAAAVTAVGDEAKAPAGAAAARPKVRRAASARVLKKKPSGRRRKKRTSDPGPPPFTVPDDGLCQDCGAQRARVGCGMCRLVFCSACSADLHACGSLRHHTGSLIPLAATAVPTGMCVRCEERPSVAVCAPCGGHALCVPCWHAAHAAPALRAHRPTMRQQCAVRGACRTKGSVAPEAAAIWRCETCDVKCCRACWQATHYGPAAPTAHRGHTPVDLYTTANSPLLLLPAETDAAAGTATATAVAPARKSELRQTIERQEQVVERKRAEELARTGVDPLYRYRLMNYFNVRCPEKLPSVVATLRQFSGREESMMQKLALVYGPEPTVDTLQAPLPPGWRVVQTPAGDVFYLNDDGRKQWAHPMT